MTPSDMKHSRGILALIAAASLATGCAREDNAGAAVLPDENARVASVAAAAPPAAPSLPAIPIKVFKDPNCGCCVKWVDHLKEHGFAVETMDMPDMSLLKKKYAITGELQSCHTAVVGDYVIEGHVPADVILKMLKDKPAIAGLAVPGMPMGSPGMEGATRERYDVLTFDRAGRTSVYAQR